MLFLALLCFLRRTDLYMLFKIRNGCKVKKFFEGDMALVMDGDSEVAIYRVSEEDDKIAKVYKML